MRDRPRRSQRRPPPSAVDPFALQPEKPAGVLRWCVDAGLFAAIFVLPFVMGGRQAIGEFTLVVIACWTTAAWLLHHTMCPNSRWRFTGMELLLAAGVALCAVQVVTLTPDVLKVLSPHLSHLLPLWLTANDPAASLALVPGQWTSVSLVPVATLRSLCCVIAVSMLFVVAVQRVDSTADAQRLMRCVAVAGTLMAVFGSAQFLFGNGRFFGFYDHPFTHTRDYAKGAFTNPNHFANYLAMAVPLLLAWYAVQSSTAPSQRSYYESPAERLARLSGPFALVSLAVVSVGILLSQSRGGLVTVCVGAIVTLALLLRQRVLSMKASATIGGIALAALMSLTFFSAHIQSLIEHNFHELVSGDVEQLDRGDARQIIWAAAAQGIADYPLLGTGLSTHREVYWTYFDHPEINGEFSHAESGYLQLALETGFVGLGIAMCALLLLLFWCGCGLRRAASPEAGALSAAIVGVLAVNLVHSITDFVWYVPSCMTIIALLAACASRLYRLSVGRPRSPSPRSLFSRGLSLAAAAGVLALGAWMIHVQRPALTAEPHWFHYIRMARNQHQLADEFDREDYHRHKLTTVLAAAEADPDNCRIQIRAASAALTLYRQERQQDPANMSLTNIREAARASQWESPQQFQDWLNNPGVLGDRTKLDEAWQRAQHALALCPLLSEGYIRLGELAWMYGASRKDEDALLVQALLVRPYDPLVHYTAGQEAWLRGKHQPALEHWKRAFSQDADYQQLIIDMLADVVPAQFFLTHFEMDAAALARLQAAYRDSPDQAGFQTVTQLLAEQLSQDAAAARHRTAVGLWRMAHESYLELGDAANARRTAYAAVEADPNALGARLLLGRWLFRNKEFAAAREHLEFSFRRRPQDKTLKKMLEIAAHHPPHSAPRTATAPDSAFHQR